MYIRKTCPCNEYPLKPHYIVKLGYRGRCISYLIIFGAKKKKIKYKNFSGANFHFCILLHGQVFLMILHGQVFVFDRQWANKITKSTNRSMVKSFSFWYHLKVELY